jgi:hypothetical protein
LTGIPMFVIKVLFKVLFKHTKLISNRKEEWDGKENKQKRTAKRDGRIPDLFK